MDESEIEADLLAMTAMAEVEAAPRVDGDPEEIEQAIIQQVEYYFSDQNLPIDAHMLGLTGGSANMPVNVSRISGFPRMRKFKPLGRIKQALRKSTVLEFADSKYIRRVQPLSVAPKIETELIPGKNAPALPVAMTKPAMTSAQPASKPLVSSTRQSLDPEKPWLTKGLLKPTGFEEYYTDAPITPADFTAEQELYRPELAFETRIETAIQRYTTRRKFHSDTAHIFDMFLSYGGIDCKERQFTGGLSKDEMDEMDASAIAAAMAKHFVAQHVEHSDDWIVDFPGVARGFLSCDRILDHTGASATSIKNVCNVLVNFYRYLLHHNVCPEYAEQIKKAMQICQVAELELVAAVQLAGELPETFNRACSALSGGLFSSLLSDSSSWGGDVDLGITLELAQNNFVAAVQQLGTKSQKEAIDIGRSLKFKKISEEEVQLQVVSVHSPDGQPAGGADDALAIRFGKIRCRMLDANFVGNLQGDESELEFWIAEETLGKCFTGMKLDMIMATNDIGCAWIERIRAVNASHYSRIPNDDWKKRDESVLPKEWYKRQRTIKEQGYNPKPKAQPIDAQEAEDDHHDTNDFGDADSGAFVSNDDAALEDDGDTMAKAMDP